MARFEKDLVDIRLELKGFVGLDWERMYEDPVFRQAMIIHGEVPLEQVHDADPLWRSTVLQEYLLHYIVRDRLLRDMPSTNGPGELHLLKLEVVDGNVDRSADAGTTAAVS